MSGIVPDDLKQKFRDEIKYYQEQIRLMREGSIPWSKSYRDAVDLARSYLPLADSLKYTLPVLNQEYQNLVDVMQEQYGRTNDCKLMSEDRQVGTLYMESLR